MLLVSILPAHVGSVKLRISIFTPRTSLTPPHSRMLWRFKYLKV
ncbi:MAG: hypothetical protein ACO2OZ_07285 [Acidilobaceae archaeon]